MDQLSDLSLDRLLSYPHLHRSLHHFISLQVSMSTSQPHFPTFQPTSSYSFYPYPLTGVSSTSSTLRSLVDPNPRTPAQAQVKSQSQGQAGPSRDRSAEIRYAEKVRQRAEKRAVIGMRPAGLAVGRESESLDIEEMRLEDEKVNPPPIV